MTMSGYESTMKLAKEHPEVMPKLAKVVRTGKTEITPEEAGDLGITQQELNLMVEYGVLKLTVEPDTG